ncbi:MAG: PAS domain S-box protein, partial [bacterium]
MKDKHERGRRHAGEMVEMLQRVARLEQSEARQDAGQELPVESEEEYRVLFTEARDGIVLIDCEAGRIVDCNPEFEAQTGRPLDELKRMEVWELGPTEKMGTVRQSFLKIREDRIGGSREWQFQRPDGEVVPVDFLSKVVTIGDKQYVQGTARDITEHKWSEETRETVNLVARLFMTSRTSEAFYQELPRMLSARFGFPSVAVRLSDMETRKMRFVGWTGPGPGVSRSPQAPVDNVISDTNGGTIQDPPPSGERAVSTVLCVPMKVGEHILGALSLADTRQRRVPPTLIDAIQVVADYVAQIIERQQVDERLTLLSNALRMTTDGIIISDTGGRILEVNEGAAKMYGGESREDLVGKNCFDFIPPEEQGRVLARFEELLDDGYVKNLEHHII